MGYLVANLHVFFETKNWMNFQCEKETWLGDPTARVVMIFWGESS